MKEITISCMTGAIAVDLLKQVKKQIYKDNQSFNLCCMAIEEIEGKLKQLKESNKVTL